MEKLTLKEVAQKIEQIKEFGEIPSYSVQACKKYLYVCRNNGQFHKGEANGKPGWAKFLGQFSRDEAVYTFLKR